MDCLVYFPSIGYHKNEEPRTSFARKQLTCGVFCGEAQAPRVQETENQFRESKVDKRLLATEHPTAVAPADDEPVPVPHPAVAVPVDTVDAVGVAGETPVRENEHHLVAQGDWDVLLVVQQVLPVILAEVGVHLLGSLDHGMADHRLLVSTQETKYVVGAVARGEAGRHDVFDEQLLRELADSIRVVGADQSAEELVADLPLQVCR